MEINIYEYIKENISNSQRQGIKIKLPESFEVDKKVIVSIEEDHSDEYKRKSS